MEVSFGCLLHINQIFVVGLDSELAKMLCTSLCDRTITSDEQEQLYVPWPVPTLVHMCFSHFVCQNILSPSQELPASASVLQNYFGLSENVHSIREGFLFSLSLCASFFDHFSLSKLQHLALKLWGSARATKFSSVTARRFVNGCVVHACGPKWWATSPEHKQIVIHSYLKINFQDMCCWCLQVWWHFICYEEGHSSESMTSK